MARIIGNIHACRTVAKSVASFFIGIGLLAFCPWAY
jgi:hypothetical protein